MLESLTIKNFGIIEHVSLELNKGLNILTGETGAGKSILIDALRFSLGDRFQSSYLRDKADHCTVEAVFALSPSIAKTLEISENFPSEDNTLIIQRSVSADGKNKVRINGLTATVIQLKTLGDRLIDFHGPHDHQLLLDSTMHIQILDALSDFGNHHAAYTSLYKEYCDICHKIATLKELSASRERDLDLLAHQVKELEQVPLDQAHLDQLEQDQLRINNAEKLFEHINAALNILEQNDTSVETLLSGAYKPVQHLADIDEHASHLLDSISTLQDNTRDLIARLKDYADALQFDPDYAKTINTQFDIYHDIKRKYGPTLDNAKTFYIQAKEKYDLLSDLEHNEGTLSKDLHACEKKLAAAAAELTSRRKKTASQLKKTIELELQELGFKSVLFEARIEPADYTASGRDRIIFYISPNAGESLKPMAEIVSSGESARIMLAIKKALMKVDPVPVLIFDEIDAQIGGRLGTVIGTKLKEISAHRQVVLITHLPQIAAFADIHFKITKSVHAGRTKTQVERIEGRASIEELAHMMSGDKMTAVSIKHAEDMLKEAKGKR